MTDVPAKVLQHYPERQQRSEVPPKERVDAAKKFMRLSPADQASLVKGIVSQIKKSNGIDGTELLPVVKRYENSDRAVLLAIQQLQDQVEGLNVSARDLGLSRPDYLKLKQDVYQAENSVIQQKVGFSPSSANLEAVLQYLQSNEVDISKLSHKKLRQLILLDDWASIARTAIPLIVKHGPRAVEYLWNAFLPKLRELAGMDAGLWEGDCAQNSTQPSKVALWSGVNKDQGNIQPLTARSNTYQDVSVDFLCSVICPERYSERRFDIVPQKTSLITGSIQYTITSDANGNTAAIVFPDNPFASGGGMVNSYAMVNPSGLAPTTGVTTAWTYGSGPVSTLSSQLIKSRISTASVAFTPTLSANQA